jgi:hypothetical protein
MDIEERNFRGLYSAIGQELQPLRPISVRRVVRRFMSIRY